jgi:hypothetical protein
MQVCPAIRFFAASFHWTVAASTSSKSESRHLGLHLLIGCDFKPFN